MTRNLIWLAVIGVLALVMIIVAVLTPMFVKRTGPAWVMTGGLLVAVVGLSMAATPLIVIAVLIKYAAIVVLPIAAIAVLRRQSSRAKAVPVFPPAPPVIPSSAA